jgi:hypothetical protein
MGWLFKKGAVTKAELQAELDDSWTSPRTKVLASAIEDDIYYAAISGHDFDGTPMVFCAVALIEIAGNEYGYKMMDETLGPYAYDCPPRIFKLLTPLKQKYAGFSADWRAKQYCATGELAC